MTELPNGIEGEEGAVVIKDHEAFLLTSSRARITLCGSTKFKPAYEYFNIYFSLMGHCVYSASMFGHADEIPFSADHKIILDQVHFRKIDNSDEIFVLDVDYYIGYSTGREIQYAVSSGKKVRYLSKEFPNYKQGDLISDAFGKLSESHKSFFSNPMAEVFIKNEIVVTQDYLGNWYNIPNRFHRFFQAALSMNNQTLIDKLFEYYRVANPETVKPTI